MDRLVAFVEAHAPGFSETLKGANPATIRALEERCGRKLPKSYAEFLSRMGDSSGEFDVYPGFAYRAGEILSYFPKATETLGYEPKHFLKIAINLETDRDEPPDVFLDLQRATEDDAPVVGFWDPSGLAPEDLPTTISAQATGYWFHDNLRLSAWRQYELAPREHTGRLAVASKLGDDGELVPDQERWWKDVCGMLDRWQWPEPLPGRSFRALVDHGVVVLAERIAEPGSPIVIRIAADDRKELVRRTELIYDSLHVLMADGRDETLLAPID